LHDRAPQEARRFLVSITHGRKATAPRRSGRLARWSQAVCFGRHRSAGLLRGIDVDARSRGKRILASGLGRGTGWGGRGSRNERAVLLWTYRRRWQRVGRGRYTQRNRSDSAESGRQGWPKQSSGRRCVPMRWKSRELWRRSILCYDGRLHVGDPSGRTSVERDLWPNVDNR
jgi:hypothetical protein